MDVDGFDRGCGQLSMLQRTMTEDVEGLVEDDIRVACVRLCDTRSAASRSEAEASDDYCRGANSINRLHSQEHTF